MTRIQFRKPSWREKRHSWWLYLLSPEFQPHMKMLYFGNKLTSPLSKGEFLLFRCWIFAPHWIAGKTDIFLKLASGWIHGSAVYISNMAPQEVRPDMLLIQNYWDIGLICYVWGESERRLSKCWGKYQRKIPVQLFWRKYAHI